MGVYGSIHAPGGTVWPIFHISGAASKPKSTLRNLQYHKMVIKSDFKAHQCGPCRQKEATGHPLDLCVMITSPCQPRETPLCAEKRNDGFPSGGMWSGRVAGCVQRVRARDPFSEIGAFVAFEVPPTHFIYFGTPLLPALFSTLAVRFYTAQGQMLCLF